jgi:hypothetical protein
LFTPQVWFARDFSIRLKNGSGQDDKLKAGSSPSASLGVGMTEGEDYDAATG